ncbi:hypothetical protein [Pseudoalteromonas piscicida]|uniref:Uncharacterized protein n=1 Tax=Pseudoalteromonas piscicida TaxID=43662 RepID=A0A2A5JRL2_PSEO7|nr:hypothetical protein [Pseudoalteromonas piscicida]PCK31969.1 hypothetical protein CEX98_09955 [Pseudoalteromonas piscicida]
MSSLFLFIFIIFSNLTFASSVNPTKITRILAGPGFGNNVMIAVSNKPKDAPSYQANAIYNYAFDGTTETGKMTLSLALAAYAAQKAVWLGGTATCTLYDGIENLKHIVVQ